MRNVRDRECDLDHRGYGEDVWELERTTGIRYPNPDAPQEQHYQCFVAQVLALMMLKHGDVDKARDEAMDRFRLNSSYERLKPYIELAIPDEKE